MVAIADFLKREQLNLEEYHYLQINSDYPFYPRFLKVDDQNFIHYVDEGPKDKDTILMVHGNPTWSFYFRHFIKEFSKNYRVVAIDHMGCGISSKPQNYFYTLNNHIENLEKLVSELDLKNIHLFAHDWGGAIGMGVATKYPQKFKSFILCNTAAFTSKFIPKRISICRNKLLNKLFLRKMNLFSLGALSMASKRGLSAEAKRGYLFPYNNYRNRVAVASFVKDIPLEMDHPSFDRLKKIEEDLSNLKNPTLFMWGAKDFCFNLKFLETFQSFFPHAQTEVYPQAGHYVLEDAKSEMIKRMKKFLGEQV